MTVALPKPSAGDVALAAILVVVGQLTTWLQLDSPDSFAGSRWANAALVALATVPALWRRFAPVAVLGVNAVVLSLPRVVTDLDVTVLGQFLPLIVLTASCGYHTAGARSLVGGVVAISGFLAISWTTPFLRTPSSLVFNGLMLLAPWAAARALRHREQRASRLGAALAHERSEFDVRMAEAVERARGEMARDLHDVVAHGVSIMVLQIGAARMTLTDDPAKAAHSLLQAEDAGRQALTDLRRMLGVLRASSADEAGATHPRHRLRDLDALVRRMRDAGLHLHVRAAQGLDGLPPAIDVSAYRIVQEAITNILKHSEADRAEVVVDVDDTHLSICVRDGGPSRQVDRGQGHGLVGIRERTALLGGHARIGRREPRGWEVAVTIPLAGTGARTVETEGSRT